MFQSSLLSILSLRGGFSQVEENKQPTNGENEQWLGGVLNKKKNKKRVKRGGRKFNKKNESFTIFSTNAAGLKKKVHSLKNEIKKSNAAVFTIQESHYNKKGKLKIENFEIFEAIRKKQSGGSLIGAHKALNPILISEYSEDFELIVIEIKIKNKEIRVMTGYGLQETWSEECHFF